MEKSNFGIMGRATFEIRASIGQRRGGGKFFFVIACTIAPGFGEFTGNYLVRI